MQRSVFLEDRAPKFELVKTAGLLTPLPQDPRTWQQVITSEALKQVPFLSGYDIDVVIERQDADLGAGFGGIIVRQMTHMTEPEQVMDQSPLAVIPVIIREWKMAPLDIFSFRGRNQPLSETRLKQALFRPTMFDAIRNRPPDRTIWRDFQPPMAATGAKLAADQLIPLLPRLSGTVRKEHQERIKQALLDPGVRALIMGNAGTQAAFASALRLEPSDFEKTAEAAVAALPPTVLQLRTDGVDVFVKTANAGAYLPTTQQMPMQAAQQMLGPGRSQQLESQGHMTMNPAASVQAPLEYDDLQVVDTFGAWVVQEVTGASLIGFCFPRVLSFGGQWLPFALFNNGSQFAIQSTIAGKMVAVSSELPRGIPRGYGAFYYLEHGKAYAYEPMIIKSAGPSPTGSGIVYIGQTNSGAVVSLHVVPGVERAVQMGPNDYAIPQKLEWMPLKGQTQLVDNPRMFSKVAATSIGEVFGDGLSFTVRGPVFAKLANDERQGISRADAEFLLVGAGVHEGFIKEALDKAATKHVVRFGNLTPIIPIREKVASSTASASKTIEKMAKVGVKNYDFSKEAALLDDPMTTDKVLGLGLINTQNVSTFVELLPSLEATVSRLCDMLLASRLGMEHVKEEALERIISGFDDVIQGLQRLQATWNADNR